jgi:S-adenosylmethionine hydrolase
MSYIALITDWQQNDYYLGAVKGFIYSQIADVNIVDINNGITKHNLFPAAFILKSCFTDFPEGTVFIIGIQTVIEGKNNYLCFQYKNRYILCSDNGFFTHFTEEEPDAVYCFKDIATTFPEKDVFAKYACKILNDENISEFANTIEEYKTVKNFNPIIEKSTITGTIIYIDNYGNAIINITKEQFVKTCKERKFKIILGNTNYFISKINNVYNENNDNEFIALFNSIGLLEIAMNNASISNLIQLEIKSNIRIQFYDT